MQRKAIRATVSGVDVDVPIHTFVATQFVYFDGSVLSTQPAVIRTGAAPVLGNLASWFNLYSITDSGISSLNVVTSASTPSANQVATFTGTGIAIQNATVTIVGGAISNVSSINSTPIGDFVKGPASAVSGNIATFNGTTGKLIQDGGLLATNVVTGVSSGVGVADHVATFTNSTGRVIQAVAVTMIGGAVANVTTLNGTFVSDFVTGPASASANNLAAYNGTSGKVIYDSTIPATSVVLGPASAGPGNVASYSGSSGKVIADSGKSASALVTNTSSAVANNLAAFNGTSGQIIYDLGIAANNVVLASTVGVNNDIVVYNGTTGRSVKDSGVLVTNVVQGPASAVSGNFASYNGSTGKLVLDSGYAPGSFATATHASNHLPGGSDPIFNNSSHTWVNGDAPMYLAADNHYWPRFLFSRILGSLSVSSTAVSPPGASFVAPRDGQYVIAFDLLISQIETTGSLEFSITSSNGTGFLVFVASCNMQGTAFGALGTPGSLVITGTAAFACRVTVGLSGVGNGSTITLKLRGISASFSVTQNGVMTVMQGDVYYALRDGMSD